MRRLGRLTYRSPGIPLQADLNSDLLTYHWRNLSAFCCFRTSSPLNNAFVVGCPGRWSWSRSVLHIGTPVPGFDGGCVRKTNENSSCCTKDEVGPPKSPCRRRLQTAVSCFSQKLRW